MRPSLRITEPIPLSRYSQYQRCSRQVYLLRAARHLSEWRRHLAGLANARGTAALPGRPVGGNSEHGRRPPMTGLRKTSIYVGGAVVNLGFNTWHSDGTEWSLDGSFPQTAGNVCPGVWERVGHRTYVTCIRHSTMRSWASRQLSFRGRQADNYPLRENKAKASSIEFC
jgi:hypothetical protein